jgi:hypothetical protein
MGLYRSYCVASADTHVTGKVDVEVIGFPWKFETARAEYYRSVLHITGTPALLN